MQYAVSDVNHHDRYKILTAFVLPRPIAWVTTLGPTGTVNAAPFSFFNVFAEDPPLCMFAVNKRPDGRLKDTWLNIERTGEFVVNLTDGMQDLADHQREGRPPARDRRGATFPYSRRAVGFQGDARPYGSLPSGRPHVRRPLLPHRRPHGVPDGVGAR